LYCAIALPLFYLARVALYHTYYPFHYPVAPYRCPLVATFATYFHIILAYKLIVNYILTIFYLPHNRPVLSPSFASSGFVVHPYMVRLALSWCIALNTPRRGAGLVRV
jgi:hypothetical protein